MISQNKTGSREADYGGFAVRSFMRTLFVTGFLALALVAIDLYTGSRLAASLKVQGFLIGFLVVVPLTALCYVLSIFLRAYIFTIMIGKRQDVRFSRVFEVTKSCSRWNVHVAVREQFGLDRQFVNLTSLMAYVPSMILVAIPSALFFGITGTWGAFQAIVSNFVLY